jgi:AcrR family transcriptional regulator
LLVRSNERYANGIGWRILAADSNSDARERILRATIELIAREGVGAVTNRRVAAGANVALGSLTYHFPSQVDLLRESLLLFVGEEVARQQEITADLRRRRPPVEEVAGEVERVVRETGDRVQQLAELELHLQAARDPELREASRRCFEAYEGVAAIGLELLGVPDAERHARSIVALMYGMSLRRLGTGDEDPSGIAAALLTIVRGAQP